MAGLEAALLERTKAAAQEKTQGPSKVRLICDPLVKVSELESCMSGYLREKSTQDLWSLVAPPPGAPQTYGWHSAPNAEWLAKTAGFLYDLVQIVKNTKVSSLKLVAALKACHENRHMDAMLCGKKTLQDNLDKLDFTIRVLLNQVRTLKGNWGLRTKTYRALGKRDQMALEITLDKVELPPELVDDQENSQESMTVRPLALVPYKEDVVSEAVCREPSKMVTNAASRGSGPMSHAGFPEAPAVFQEILGKESAPKPLPFGLPSSATLKGHRPYVEYTPKALAGKGKKKSQNVKKTKGEDDAPTVLKRPSSKSSLADVEAPQVPQKKQKKKMKDEESEVPRAMKRPSSKGAGADEEPPQVQLEEFETKYSPGKYREVMQKYIEDYMESEAQHGRSRSREDARKQWALSLKRAHILKGLSLSELKKRRFVDKACRENPFQARVAAADVD